MILEEILGSRLRAKVLSWLFSHPDERYFGRQLEDLLKEDSTNISRELARLAGMGVLLRQPEGRQKYYQVNKRCPVFSELQGLVIKTTGLVDVLRESLRPLLKKIKVAFVYGSFAKGSLNADSDVDLLVIGSCTFGQAVEALSQAQDKLARDVNPSVYPVKEFNKKVKAKHHFLNTVLREPKIFLIGDDNDLTGLAQ